MCEEVPDLLPTHCEGDGFTSNADDVVEVCNVVWLFNKFDGWIVIIKTALIILLVVRVTLLEFKSIETKLTVSSGCSDHFRSLAYSNFINAI